MSKILLVDDNNDFRKSLSKRLTLRGYEVIDLDNGEDAVRVSRSDQDIEVIVLDRKMPGMGGEQTLKEIRTFRPLTPFLWNREEMLSRFTANVKRTPAKS